MSFEDNFHTPEVNPEGEQHDENVNHEHSEEGSSEHQESENLGHESSEEHHDREKRSPQELALAMIKEGRGDALAQRFMLDEEFANQLDQRAIAQELIEAGQCMALFQMLDDMKNIESEAGSILTQVVERGHAHDLLIYLTSYDPWN